MNLAGGILNIFGWDIYSEARVLAITGTNGVEIQNGYNGLDWFAILFSVHEHIYKVLFLIVYLMGLKPVFMNHKIDG